MVASRSPFRWQRVPRVFGDPSAVTGHHPGYCSRRWGPPGCPPLITSRLPQNIPAGKYGEIIVTSIHVLPSDLESLQDCGLQGWCGVGLVVRRLHVRRTDMIGLTNPVVTVSTVLGWCPLPAAHLRLLKVSLPDSLTVLFLFAQFSRGLTTAPTDFLSLTDFLPRKSVFAACAGRLQRS